MVLSIKTAVSKNAKILALFAIVCTAIVGLVCLDPRSSIGTKIRTNPRVESTHTGGTINRTHIHTYTYIHMCTYIYYTLRTSL